MNSRWESGLAAAATALNATAVWESALPASTEAAALDYLSKRRVDPMAVEERDLVRVLVGGAPSLQHVPQLVRAGAWLVIRQFSSDGAQGGLFAVALDPPHDEVQMGEGLAADALAWRFLVALPLADDSSAATLIQRVGLWVVEGSDLWLRAVSERSDADEAAPAVFGLLGRSALPSDLTRRLLDATPVTLALSRATETRALQLLSVARRTPLQVARAEVHR
jgi:hypothetical protein